MKRLIPKRLSSSRGDMFCELTLVLLLIAVVAVQGLASLKTPLNVAFYRMAAAIFAGDINRKAAEGDTSFQEAKKYLVASGGSCSTMPCGTDTTGQGNGIGGP